MHYFLGNLETVLNIVQSLVVIVGFPLAFWQIHLQLEQTKQSNYIAAIAGREAITQREIANKDLLQIYSLDYFPSVTNIAEFNALSDQKKTLYMHLGTLISAQERAINLFSTEPTNRDDLYAEWVAMDEIADLPMFQAVWPYLKQFYRKSFADEVDTRRDARMKLRAV